jgi:hypothetical protein
MPILVKVESLSPVTKGESKPTQRGMVFTRTTLLATVVKAREEIHAGRNGEREQIRARPGTNHSERAAFLAPVQGRREQNLGGQAGPVSGDGREGAGEAGEDGSRGDGTDAE